MASTAQPAPGTAHYPPEADDITLGKVSALRKELESSLTFDDEELTQKYKSWVTEAVASARSKSSKITDSTLDAALEDVRAKFKDIAGPPNIQTEKPKGKARAMKENVGSVFRKIFRAGKSPTAEVGKLGVSDQEYALLKAEEIVAPLQDLAGEVNTAGNDFGSKSGQEISEKDTGLGGAGLVEDDESERAAQRHDPDEVSPDNGFPEDGRDVKCAVGAHSGMSAERKSAPVRKPVDVGSASPTSPLEMRERERVELEPLEEDEEAKRGGLHHDLQEKLPSSFPEDEGDVKVPASPRHA